MMNKILTAVAVVISVAALVVGFASFNKDVPASQVSVGEKGEKGDKGDKGDVGPAGKNGSSLAGAVSGPDTYFPYVANNNLQKFGETKGFTIATTTVCAIKSPSATSTLVFGGVNFTTSSTSASVVTLAKATTPYATTTALNTLSIGAGAQGAIIATSSVSAVGVVSNNIFAPSTYFVVGMQGGVGTFSPAGSCSAEFVRI